MRNFKFNKTIRNTAILILSVVLCACATTPEAKLARASRRVSETPFPERPALYVQLERKGMITPATREEWQKAWELRQKRQEEERIADEKWHEQSRIAAEKANRKAQEERRRWWASLTPGEKMQYEMQQQQMAFQSQQQEQQMAFQANQQRQAAIQTAVQNIQQSIQQQQAASQATFRDYQQSVQQQQGIDAYNRRTQVLSQPVNIQHTGYINHNVSGY